MTITESVQGISYMGMGIWVEGWGEEIFYLWMEQGTWNSNEYLMRYVFVPRHIIVDKIQRTLFFLYFENPAFLGIIGGKGTQGREKVCHILELWWTPVWRIGFHLCICKGYSGEDNNLRIKELGIWNKWVTICIAQKLKIGKHKNW